MEITATCQQIITVDDISVPVLTCPEPDTTLCSIDDVPPFADLDAFPGSEEA